MSVAACNFKVCAVLVPLSLSGFPSLSSDWNPATSPAPVCMNDHGLFCHDIMIAVHVCFNCLVNCILSTALLMNILTSVVMLTVNDVVLKIFRTT